MRRYTQLAYLFHQCATSLLSRDSRVADYTVERPFSSSSFCCAASRVQLANWMVVDCSLELTSHSASDLCSVTEVTFLAFRSTVSVNFNSKNNNNPL